MAPTLSPQHKAITAYHAALKVFSKHGATHEGATETAFSNHLATTAKAAAGWTLIPKQAGRADGKAIIPDGTLRDSFNLRRGFWEAKDTDDDLDKEIAMKNAKKHPLSNTIFEDTRTAVLYQNGREAARYDLAKPENVADLLTQFFRHTEPEHDDFDRAVDDFKERVPDLAKG